VEQNRKAIQNPQRGVAPIEEDEEEDYVCMFQFQLLSLARIP